MTVITIYERTKEDLTIIKNPWAYGSALITPRTSKATAWLTGNIWYSRWQPVGIELDKPVTLSLDGARELEAMARADGLQVEGL